MWRKLFIGGFLSLVLLAGLAGYGVYQWLNYPLNITGSQQLYQVNTGDSLISIANNLADKNILTFPRLLSLYGQLNGKTNIKTGEYYLTPEDTPKSLLDKLLEGKVVTYTVTVAEGWTFKKMLETLHQQEKLVAELADPELLQEFLDQLELEQGNPEGWFFPDTYTYVAGSSDRDILRQAHNRMRDVLNTEWAQRVGALPYAGPYEALIMASIVERETGVPSEREEIAGVFVRRLEKNMRLQTDPTVIYGMGDQYQGNIRRRHLSEPTPYNTYVIDGLPPTPIALPGREAIYAALHPAEGEALYFVARGDGSHQFSVTLEEHNRAVQTYQRQRVENYRSSPAPDSSENE